MQRWRRRGRVRAAAAEATGGGRHQGEHKTDEVFSKALVACHSLQPKKTRRDLGPAPLCLFPISERPRKSPQKVTT